MGFVAHLRSRALWGTRRRRCLATTLGLVCVGLVGASPRTAEAGPAANWLAEHRQIEVAGNAGWRASWADERNPGFQFYGGGPELNVGLEFDNGFGFLIGGRAMFGGANSDSPSLRPVLSEAGGQVMAQLRVSDWVRVGLGASAGRFFRCCDAAGSEPVPAAEALLFGGFARVGIDFYPRSAPVLRALSIWMRIQIDGHRAAVEETLHPDVSLNLGIGLGLRL